MTDMGPRRMDGFARPARSAGAPPAQNPDVRAAVAPSRPAGPSVQPMRPTHNHQTEPESQAKPASAKRGGGWKVVLQFVIGLLVIVGVAAAIVMLYIKYYQQ